MPQIDSIYIAASAQDARYTRTCAGSVRFFYPDIPIRILAGGPLRSGLVTELRQYWDVSLADIPTGDYGWGFVKLEPLFGRSGERFLVLDSDTVLTGRVLDLWRESQAPFLVDDEAQSEARTHAIYYDWERVRQIDPSARRPQFVFNTGQWFGTAGVLTRDDFAPWIEWKMPRRTTPPGHFMNGEQGILNYVLNQKVALEDLRVDRKQIMRWPGHSLDGLNAESVSRSTAAPRIVHWAGMKRARQRDMVGADLLAFFEKAYYRPFPAGGARRVFAGYQDTVSCYLLDFQVRVRLASRKIFAPPKAPTAGS